MDSSLGEFDVNVCWPWDWNADSGFVVDWGSLYHFLTRLEDRRDPRGVRYPLAWVLTLALLAKLAGEDRLTGPPMADGMGTASQGGSGAGDGFAASPSTPPDYVQPDPGVNSVG